MVGPKSALGGALPMASPSIWIDLCGVFTHHCERSKHLSCGGLPQPALKQHRGDLRAGQRPGSHRLRKRAPRLHL